MNDNTDNFLQELDQFEKKILQKINEDKSKKNKMHNSATHQPIKIDQQLENIINNLPDPVEKWIAEQNTESKQSKMIKKFATIIKNLQATRENELLAQVQIFINNTNNSNLAQLQIKDKEIVNLNKQLKDNSNKKKIQNAQPILTIPTEVWALATDQKGNVYIGTRSSYNKGAVYQCLAGESEFKPMLGIEGEVWTIVVDKNENIYAGTKGNGYTGNVYKCLAGDTKFKPMSGINKCVSCLTFDNKDNLYVGVFTGDSRKEANSGNVYQCLAGDTKFKPMSGINKKDGIISLLYDKDKNVLYASAWNGKNRIDTNDGSLYKCDLSKEDNPFVLIEKQLTAIWHLESKNGKPFIDNQHYLHINKNMKWK